MKLTFKKWILVWGILGILVPAVLLLRWKMFGSAFGSLEVELWPTSVMTMALEGNVKAWDVFFVYAIALFGNAILYCLPGLLTWPLLRFILQRSAQVQQ